MRDGGGGSDDLAPVIPLFGRHTPRPTGADDAAIVGDTEPRGRASGEGARASVEAEESGRGEPAVWRSTWSDDVAGRMPRPAASVDTRGPSDRHPARGASARNAPRLRALESEESQRHDPEGSDASGLRAAAEELLVRKLRMRSLSVSEARMVLKGFGADPDRLDAGTIDDILDDFGRRGYLDDAVLAGQLVASGIERKGQGRVALARALAQRGVPRDVIDAALDEVPDDDAERALDYARTKARGLARLDGDTALRRLVGQLSRRGYNGSVAMTAAKTALAEASFGRPTSGVRFTESD